jgi:hypothetical protein
VAAEERSASTQEELCARDHVVASVVSLFSARHNVGAYVLSLLALSILLPLLRRSQAAFSQACGALQPRMPRPFSAPAPTEPARASRCCVPHRRDRARYHGQRHGVLDRREHAPDVADAP